MAHGDGGKWGMGRALRAEWTKLTSVRAWVIALLASMAVIVLLGALAASGTNYGCGGGPQSFCAPILGPNGQPVNDNFTFVHQALSSNGTITAQVAAITGSITSTNPAPAGQGPLAGAQPGLEGWAKAGLIIKASTTPGSAYAAVMLTGSHGVRLQYNYVHDRAGPTSGIPRWLQLRRTGDAVTAATSVDGVHWTTIGTVRIRQLNGVVLVGLFAASPQFTQVTQHPFGQQAVGGPTDATATFDHVRLEASGTGQGWTETVVGGTGGPGGMPTGYRQAGATFTVTGSGDIAPVAGGQANGGGQPFEHTLLGTFLGLIVMVVIAALFMTAEYRRGLIRTTLVATPRRSRVLLAKVAVITTVAFIAGTVAAVIAVAISDPILKAHGVPITPIGLGTKLRVETGTGLIMAGSAALALATGTIFRRSVGAVTLVFAVIVVPYILATGGVLSSGAGEWLLRVSPAAAFAAQQTLREYSQVQVAYTPANGFYPLGAWAGVAVLFGYAAAAIGLAAYRLNRRDA